MPPKTQDCITDEYLNEISLYPEARKQLQEALMNHGGFIEAGGKKYLLLDARDAVRMKRDYLRQYPPKQQPSFWGKVVRRFAYRFAQLQPNRRRSAAGRRSSPFRR